MVKILPRAVIGVSLAALVAEINAGSCAPFYSEPHEPMRADIVMGITASGFATYNVHVSAEQVMKPGKIVGEAPTPDLSSGFSRTIR